MRVIADGVGGAELRLWTESGADPTALVRPAPSAAAPLGPPTTVLKSVPGVSSRAPECVYRAWSFGDESSTYRVVTDLGCTQLANGVPPMGSVAQVVRVTAARGTETLWCVE